MKSCSKCKEVQSFSKFSKNSRSKDGLQSQCRDCVNLYATTHKLERAVYRAKTRDKIAAARSKRKIQDAILNKAWRAANKEYLAEYCRINAEQKRANNALRRARMMNASIGFLPKDIKTLLIGLYGECCMYPNCNNKEELEVDHVVALANEGAHSIDNMQILCMFHNRSKGSHHNTDYRMEPNEDLV